MHKSRGDRLSAGWSQGGDRIRPAARGGAGWRTAAWFDTALSCGLAAGVLLLYAATLLPGLGSRDTAEFQWVVPTLGLAHPTGYPLYTLLGWLWCQLPLGGDMAWRMNLFSAATAAAAVGVVYHVARALGQARGVAAAAALALGVSRTFWSQATIAEVYALAALIQALLLLALLRWRAGRWPLWPVGMLLGLGLAHHRSIVLMLPGALLLLVVSHTGPRDATRAYTQPEPAAPAVAQPGKHQRNPVLERRNAQAHPAPMITITDVALALLGVLAGCLLYLYVPLRAPAWMQAWPQVWDHISGASLTATWLDPARLRAEGARRLLGLLRQFVWPQLLPAGAALALLGAVRLLRRDGAAAALLLLSYALVIGFCAAYYVADIEVFFIPAHLLAALLLGEGAAWLLAGWQGSRLAGWINTRAPGLNVSTLQPANLLTLAVLVLPALLVWHNLPALRVLNSSDDERIAREVMAQPLPQGALVIGDWYATEGPHYLQVIEGLRLDLQFGSGLGQPAVIEAIDHGRAVYLTSPDLSLGLTQWPEGRLWRVSRAPLAAVTAADVAWADGIALTGYTLPPGPYQPGTSVPVMLQWQASGAPQADYSFFVHLVGADGQIWGQQDQSAAQAPTSRWQPGKRYADLVSPTLRPDAPPGRYRVALGWYLYPAMQRLALAEGPADYITLGEIEVAAPR